MTNGKKTSGRQKIEIKKRDNTSTRTVTFSKRRKRLFHKASELCITTNAEVLILAQSVGGGRVFAFAHPSVDHVIDTYLGKNGSDQSRVSEDVAGMYEEFNKEHLKILEETEVEKKKSKDVKESAGPWWENSYEDLEVEELEFLIYSMEELKNNVTNKADELRNLATASSSFQEIANANNADGLLDDQVILPNEDHSLPYNVGFANEDLMMPAINYDSNGFNNYGFGNEEFFLDNHDYNEHHEGGNNLQVQSDYSTFGVPDDLISFDQD